MMQTSWSRDYINKRYGNANIWAREKQQELEAKTDLKWTWCSQHCKLEFSPTWSSKTKPIEDEMIGGWLLELAPTASKAISFLKAADELGLELEQVIGIMYWLVKQCRAVAVVNRMGKAVGYYMRRI